MLSFDSMAIVVKVVPSTIETLDASKNKNPLDIKNREAEINITSKMLN